MADLRLGAPCRRRAARTAPVLLGGLGALVASVWWRKHPSACPYGQRFWVQAPHPLITRRRLLATLEPCAGERLLEIGPGTGYYALEIAHSLAPAGQLEVLDIQQEMIDHTLRSARRAGVRNIAGTRADATSMPYPDATFDGAYLVTVLGEIPSQFGALLELRRVLKPHGRLVVGELFGDPHMVTFKKLRMQADAAGFCFERRAGGPLGYFARFATV